MESNVFIPGATRGRIGAFVVGSPSSTCEILGAFPDSRDLDVQTCNGGVLSLVTMMKGHMRPCIGIVDSSAQSVHLIQKAMRALNMQRELNGFIGTPSYGRPMTILVCDSYEKCGEGVSWGYDLAVERSQAAGVISGLVQRALYNP